MNTEYLAFVGLTLEQGLLLLTEAARDVEHGRYLGDLKLLGRLRQRPSDRPSMGPTVTLVVPPVRQGQKTQDAMRSAMHKYAQEHPEQQWSPRIYASESDLDVHDLQEVSIAQIIEATLMNSRARGDGARPHPAGRELLAAAEFRQAAALAEHFQVLAFHATNVRVAVAARSGKLDLAVFHVRDDPARHSTVSSVRVTDVYPELCWLSVHHTDYGAVCLPDGAPPVQDVVALVGRFVCEASAYFSERQEAAAASRLLLALVPEPLSAGAQANRYQLLYLPTLRFMEQYHVAEAASDYARVEVVALRNSTSIDKDALRKAIQQAYPPVGYRLRLRETRLRLYPYHQAPDEADQEEERLIRDIGEMYYELAFLRSMRIRKPVLLRFTQAQLPAMADLLRGMVPSLLRPPESYDSPDNLPLRYAFQALGEFPYGYHYLLVSPDAATPLDYAHLTQWAELEDKAEIRFWLDPSWSLYDTAPSSRSYVFVPYGTTLFPALHSWDVTDLDHFLRETLREWLQEPSDEACLPDRPLYVFDRAPNSRTQSGEAVDIAVSILDFEHFGALSTKLPWVNYNLVLHTEMCQPGFWHAVEEYVCAAGDTRIRSLLLEQKAATPAQVRATFERAAESVRSHVAQSIQALTYSVSTQLKRIAEESAKTAADAQVLNRQLRELENDYASLHQLVQQVVSEQTTIHKESSKVERTARDLDAEVKRAATAAQEAVRHLRDVVSAQLADLRHAEDEQLQRLAEIHFELRRFT